MNNLLPKLMLGGSTVVLATVMTANGVLAQNDGIEQVVVSASRITIAGYSQPTPVTVVGAAQLEQDAYANIQDSIRSLPQVTSPPASFGTSQTAATNGTAGANFINLRNLGNNRTLILFDSQRVVGTTILGGGGVDITTFPSALISRVDVVTGGASAAWGSDAIAGVVNFVLNKNFTGFKATIQGSDTSDGLDRALSATAAWGGDIDGGRGHFEVSATANIRPDTVLITDEGWFKNAYWVSNPAFVAGNGQPQLIEANNVGLAGFTPGGLIVSSPAGVAGPGLVAAPANALRGIQFVQGGTPQLVNFGNVTLGTISNGGSLTGTDSLVYTGPISTPNNTYTFFGYGRYKLTDSIQASAQLNYGYFTGRATTIALSESLAVKSDNAYIPASVRSSMQNGGITSFTMGILNVNNTNMQTATGAKYFNNSEGGVGPGTVFNRRNLLRGVFTLDGTIGNDWSWTTYIQHGEARFSAHFLAQPNKANIQNAHDAVTVTTANVAKSGLPLGSIACRATLTGAAVIVGNATAQPGCIPLDPFGIGVASPAAIAYVDGYSNNSPDFMHQSIQQEVAEGSMQGTLPWELPAGKVAIAFGMGYRKESGAVTTSPQAQLGAFANGDNVIFGPASYNVIEGFAELGAPILKNNIVNSLDFSAAGRITSYSTSGLVETWKLGATSQINDDIKLRTTWSVDIRAPQLNDLFSKGVIGTNSVRDPKSQITTSVITLTDGNPNLVPEIARTISGGVVLTPSFIPSLSLSADWYSINMTGAIAVVSLANVLNQCNPTLPSTIYPGQNGNPNDPLCQELVFNGPNGALSQINNGVINIASETTSGLDLQANYTMDFWEGSLAWSASANLNDESTITQPGSGVNDFAGSNVPPASGPLGGALAAGPKWKGILAATYTAGSYAFTVQGRWFGTNISYQNGNTGNQASAATANLYDPAHFELPFTAYLDLRGSYRWNDNISFYGAIDNTLDNPPPLLVTLPSVTNPGNNNTNISVYDMLGRVFRVGIRLNY